MSDPGPTDALAAEYVLGTLDAERSSLSPDWASATRTETLAAIAREYTEKGRLLFVATTNLDVPVGVLWNMGSIAASGHSARRVLAARLRPSSHKASELGWLIG